MEGILELQRRSHEIVDHLEEAITQAMVQQPKTQKGRLLQEHYVSSLLDQIVESSDLLESLYADSEGRQIDLDRVTLPEGDSFGSFYDQLKSIKDRHRRLESTIEDLVEAESIKATARLSDDQLAKKFSGEESLGRFLDLLEPYEMYINLKDVKKVEYLRYLDHVDRFDQIPVSVKSNPGYKAYLMALKGYLADFTKRTRPLLDQKALLEKALEEFSKRWARAAIVGWEELANNESDELFCEACQKQFYNPSVFKAHIPGKKHQKAAAEMEKSNSGKNSTSEGRWAKEAAALEASISCFFGMLAKEREETKNHIEAKQSRSSEERALDLEREEAEIEEPKGKFDEEEEDEERDPKIYNPLNLPLDWDGKPIPYWLWKLHGLGTRYPCEICGNQVYMGRKAFDQHFYEWRHSQGLRCLGIPNTRHFFQVISIQDAQALWDKLKKDARQANFRPEVMEEVEDQHGNVYSRKTYEDLKRQGLI